MTLTRLTRRGWIRLTASFVASGAALGPSLARAGDPERVLLVGDSMIAGAFGLYLGNALEADGQIVERQGKTSSGLARPDFYDWIDEGARASKSFAPTAVVCMFGGNDGQGLWMGKSADPEWIRWGEPSWDPEYRRRVNAFADGITSNGARLFWVGMPTMRLEKLHARVDHMNTIFRGEMAIRRQAWFVDVWHLLANDSGEYVDRLVVDGARKRVRAGDGVHLTRDGAKVLVDHVHPFIRATLSPPSADDSVSQGM